MYACCFYVLQQLLVSLSNVTNLETAVYWSHINHEQASGMLLLQHIDTYLSTLSVAMHKAQSSPFEAVSDNIGKFANTVCGILK